MAMYEGNWKCSSCGGAITQLPFQPRSESGLTCRACYAKQKERESGTATPPEMQTANEPMSDEGVPDWDDSQIAGEPVPGDETIGEPVTAGEKPKFSGDWACAICGATIASLPFEPRSTDNLKCLECFKEGKS